MNGAFNVYYDSAISRGQHSLAYCVIPVHAEYYDYTQRHSTWASHETSHIPTLEILHLSLTLECLENLKICQIVSLMSWLQNYAVKDRREGGCDTLWQHVTRSRMSQLGWLAWDSRRQNKTVYDEIISTVPIRLIRALNTLWGQPGCVVCIIRHFHGKIAKKKKRDNFFKTIFHHDPEHLGQVWVVCMQFRHSRAGLHTQNGVKRTTTARNMASNMNGPCFEAKSATLTTGPYLRTSISPQQHNIFEYLKVDACIVGQALSLRIKG